MRNARYKNQQVYLPLRTLEYPEIPGFLETPEKISETPGLLLVTPKAVKKMRN
jgi:hypothetical protein